VPLNKKGKKIMKSMKDQYGSKRGEQVFYASMNKGKIKGVEKKKNGGLGEKSGPPPKKGPASQGIKVLKLRGGGMDMGASSSSSGGGGRDAGMGMGGKSRSSNTSSSNTGGRDTDFQQRGMSKADYAKSTQTQNFGGRDTKTTVTARKGPLQVPVIGPVSFVANKVLESMYNSKNLKEQKKEDVLGGEMLTTGKRTTPTPMGGGGGNGGGQQPIKITPTKVTSTSTVPIPLMKVQPKMFPFEYKDGGLVRGSGKVLKGRVKKAKIY
jgi:hypothetical protein